ncbi:uncharacterized protein GGS22DRAFT_195043 [Annulohypoxylon maeteangense]|uniref:uncharacterized protein n=1 Tax=Annulohypoxylon maeteangense TaxID=1927788 RepID=UPI002007D52B|nr:uncharacterized protein GGS22DRAFT_195043 [Annulohypoxylon maeteangense]KAI0883865.1 hypothetical protein GGS22DRAFT_195043 [Annulohypoxylon maeteangense]
MPRKQLSLQQLFHRGFNSGLHWQTQAKDVYDERLRRELKKHRFLLHHPHSIHLAKVLARELNTTNRTIISLALSHVYEFAAEKIELCRDFEPEEFFARAKNSFAWSSKINDHAFWAFTYKAFHARAIFLNVTLRPGEEPPAGQPLAQALDRFLDEFLRYYPIHQTDVLQKGDKICQENLELAEDEVSLNKPVFDKYFPHHLTHHEGQGDGTDKLVLDMEEIQRPAREAGAAIGEHFEAIALSKVPDEELFFYDTECRTSHRDAFLDDTVHEKSGTLKGWESPKGMGGVRKYDSFREYREPVSAEGDESGEGDATRPAEQQGDEDVDDVMGEAGVDDYLPEAKRLKNLKLD